MSWRERFVRWVDPFLRGAASILDLGGVLGPKLSGLSPEEQDCNAIASDWQAVGDDIRRVIEKEAK